MGAAPRMRIRLNVVLCHVSLPPAVCREIDLFCLHCSASNPLQSWLLVSRSVRPDPEVICVANFAGCQARSCFDCFHSFFRLAHQPCSVIGMCAAAAERKGNAMEAWKRKSEELGAQIAEDKK